jgi:hypothetical protein
MKRRNAFLLLIAFVLTMTVSAASKTVYYTPKGEKYHVSSCSTLKRSKTVYSCTLEEARRKGLEACKVCKP